MLVRNSLRHSKQLWRFVLVFLLSIVFNGCASVPPSVKKVATKNGIAANNITKFAGVVFLYTIGWVPGAFPYGVSEKHESHCKSATAVATVIWVSPSITKHDGELACRWILGATGYVGQFIHHAFPVINYRLYLVPQGYGAEQKSLSWTLFGRLEPLYVAHWYDSLEETRANIVDTYAHESVHLMAVLIGMTNQDYHNEHIASLAGVCAQLYVNGILYKSNYVVAKPEQGMELPKSYFQSMDSEWYLGADLISLFKGHKIIRRDSLTGMKINNYCRSKLASFFSMKKQ